MRKINIKQKPNSLKKAIFLKIMDRFQKSIISCFNNDTQFKKELSFCTYGVSLIIKILSNPIAGFIYDENGFHAVKNPEGRHYDVSLDLKSNTSIYNIIIKKISVTQTIIEKKAVINGDSGYCTAFLRAMDIYKEKRGGFLRLLFYHELKKNDKKEALIGDSKELRVYEQS